MDPNEMQTIINSNTGQIIGYLITLYAVVPSIVITMMYTFLSETEEDIALLWPYVKQDSGKIHTCAISVYKFIIISSKMFHLSMSYYLAMLFVSLFSKCVKLQPTSVITAFLVATIVYSLYSGFYIIKDAYIAIKATFNESKHKRFLWIFGIAILYILLPLGLAIYLKLRKQQEETSLHLFWITLTIFHLFLWWWILPFLYRPLTCLSYIRRSLKQPNSKCPLLK